MALFQAEPKLTLKCCYVQRREKKIRRAEVARSSCVVGLYLRILQVVLMYYCTDINIVRVTCASLSKVGFTTELMLRIL